MIFSDYSCLVTAFLYKSTLIAIVLEICEEGSNSIPLTCAVHNIIIIQIVHEVREKHKYNKK